MNLIFSWFFNQNSEAFSMLLFSLIAKIEWTELMNLWKKNWIELIILGELDYLAFKIEGNMESADFNFIRLYNYLLIKIVALIGK